MLKIASATFLAVLFGYAFASRCPLKILTRPCTCEPAGGKTLHCDGVKDAAVLEGVFRRTGNAKFTNLELVQSQIESIPTSLMIRKQFHAIEAIACNLTSLFDKTLNASNFVEIVFLQDVHFSGGYPWKQFKSLKHLKTLLSHNITVPAINSSFTDNVSKDLTHFMFYDTRTREIKGNVFSKYKQLQEVRIQKSQLKTLKRSYFPRHSKIQLFHFDQNEIETLPNNLFSNMPNLRSVGLSQNRISTISEAVFGRIYNQLRYLSLKGNPINCDCHVKWIASHPPRNYLDGECAVPENLKGKKIKSLQNSDLQSC